LGEVVDLLPADQITTTIAAITAWIESLGVEERVSAGAIDAMLVAETLAGRLPEREAAAVRRDVRALGARVIRIRAIPEQVSFDVRWFAVQAGRPVQIVLVNPDAMPHNLVVGRPGALETIGAAAASMPMPADPDARPFVPDIPEVLFATKLAQQDETLRLSFTAPAEPGAYVFACTFPGHWLRMYGVMLVVPSLEAWEAAPTVPNDPMTGQPFPSVSR
jgi:azurin